MNARKLPRPWVILCIICCVSVAKPLGAAAQCTGPVQSVTYSTTLTGVGGNFYIVNSLPQFPTTSGTLLSAVVKGVLTETSQLTLNNTNSSSQDLFPSTSRSDVIKLNGVTLGAPGGAGYGGYPEAILNPSPGPGNTQSDPIATIYNNTQDYRDSVQNSNPVFPSFSGSGSLAFTYKTTSFPGGIPTGVISNYNFSESIVFSVTYYYCAIILSTNILTFTANRAGDHDVQLNWISSNEQAGTIYDVEMSADGRAFSRFDARQAVANHLDASYTDTYTIPPGTTGKLYFRLKIVNLDGSVSYSEVKLVDLDGTAFSGFHLYPDPPDAGFVNIAFGTSSQGWQVDLFTASGSLIQRNYYYNTATARVDFRNPLSSGAYFVRATDQQTGKNYTASFLIRK